MTSPEPPEVTVAPDLVETVRLGLLCVDRLTVRAGAEGGTSPRVVGDDARIAPRVTLVRSMYRRFGIDPTKTRPSSEALRRRVSRGLGLPRINTLVDAGNRCSLETALPFGVYDLARVSGGVVLRRGTAGDTYAGIGKAVVHLDGRPALFDAAGPFGNPTADSARTMVTPATTAALVVVYAPAPLPRSALDAVLELTTARVVEATGGREWKRWVAPCV